MPPTCDGRSAGCEKSGTGCVRVLEADQGGRDDSGRPFIRHGKRDVGRAGCRRARGRCERLAHACGRWKVQLERIAAHARIDHARNVRAAHLGILEDARDAGEVHGREAEQEVEVDLTRERVCDEEFGVFDGRLCVWFGVCGRPLEAEARSEGGKTEARKFKRVDRNKRVVCAVTAVKPRRQMLENTKRGRGSGA